jgi:hypothetical protein
MTEPLSWLQRNADWHHRRGLLKTGRAVVTINLWGPEGNRTDRAGVPCVQEHCGIPNDAWNNDDTNENTQTNGVKDYFYRYDTLTWDGANKQAYSGYKVIGLGFGGIAQMFGAKGHTNDANALPASRLVSGMSWLRLGRDAAVGGTTIFIKGDDSTAWRPVTRSFSPPLTMFPAILNP